MKPIGKITHYYDKLGVVVVELHGGLKIGDSIKIEGPETSFEQKVSSIHKNYQPAESANSGDEVGLKVDREVKEGSLVILLD